LAWDALDAFTPEAWDRARNVLHGNDAASVSLKSAAAAAGVSLRVLKRWIARSRERRIEDDPFIHTIAEDVDAAIEEQTATLEDEAWKRALNGTPKDVYCQGIVVGQEAKHDNALLMRMLEHRDPSYRRNAEVEVKLSLGEPQEIYARLLAGQRLAEARQEAIEAEYSHVE